MRLVLATRNAHKVRELAALMAPHAIEPLPDDVQLPPETGTTFAENAFGKARAAAAATGRAAIADDSGIEAADLGGAPGVYSARYAGVHATYAERMARLLGEIEAAGGTDRRARFVCVIAVADPSDGKVETFEGVCEGRIAREPRGTGGFGYDPLFIPDGYDRTFGELPVEVKHTLSHRARALAKAVKHLRTRYTDTGLTH